MITYGGAGGYCPRVHQFIWLVYPTGVGCLAIVGNERLSSRNVHSPSPDLSGHYGQERPSGQTNVAHTINI